MELSSVVRRRVSPAQKSEAEEERERVGERKKVEAGSLTQAQVP